MGRVPHFCLTLLTVAALLGVSACERRGDSANGRSGASQPAAATHWKIANAGEPVIQIDDRELSQAIAQAKATAEDARARWTQCSPDERKAWVVKWAAPLETTDDGELAGRVEHVWVQPLNWSQFRIEGVLMSEPVGVIAGGKKLGDLVSFPIEELSDWARFASDASTATSRTTGPPVEGGFTIRVLEDRFGKPPAGASR